jgi:hypothetical protein
VPLRNGGVEGRQQIGADRNDVEAAQQHEDGVEKAMVGAVWRGSVHEIGGLERGLSASR